MTIGDQITLRAFTSNDKMNFGRPSRTWFPSDSGDTRIGRQPDQSSTTSWARLRRLERRRRRPGEERLTRSTPIYRTRNTNLIGQFAYETSDCTTTSKRSGTTEIASSTRTRPAWS
jgi:hypothetical protein